MHDVQTQISPPFPDLASPALASPALAPETLTPERVAARLRGLRGQWFGVAALYALALAGGHLLIAAPGVAPYWTLLAGAAMAVQLAILWWALPQNRRAPDTPLRAALGLANHLTLVRGLLTCLLAGFLFAPLPAGALAWAPALLYGLERAIDFVDGWVARRTRGETLLGSILDIEFDGLGLLIAAVLGVQYGLLPGWYLLLGLTRPLFALGLLWRRRRGRVVHDLPPSDHRRVIAGLQTGFVSIVLWPVWSSEATRWAACCFAVPLVLSFARDWLVVSGVVDAGTSGYAGARRAAKRWVEGRLPPAARLSAGGLAVALLVRQGEPAALWLVVLPAALLLLAGVLGRAAATVLLVYAGLVATATGLHAETALLMACAALVAHTGSGRYALWQPEERLIRVKLGDATSSLDAKAQRRNHSHSKKDQYTDKHR